MVKKIIRRKSRINGTNAVLILKIIISDGRDTYEVEGQASSFQIRSDWYQTRKKAIMSAIWNFYYRKGLNYGSPEINQLQGRGLQMKIVDWWIEYREGEFFSIKRINRRGKYYNILRSRRTGKIISMSKWKQVRDSDVENSELQEELNFEE
ncbi:MAG: hypothetical protein ACOC56_02060 [Atribacterota bacterium]